MSRAACTDAPESRTWTCLFDRHSMHRFLALGGMHSAWCPSICCVFACHQMHHAFCHLNPEFRIFAVAHRFRDKSVTQLLYKPTKPVIRTSSASLDFPSPSATSDNLGTTSSDSLVRRTSELRQLSKDVRLQSVRISSTRRSREDSAGQEYTSYLIDSVLSVHGVQTTLRSERRYKHFNLLDELLRREFPSLVPQVSLPADTPAREIVCGELLVCTLSPVLPSRICVESTSLSPSHSMYHIYIYV